MSASFASRQKRDDEIEPPPSRNTKNYASYPLTSNTRYYGDSTIHATSDSKYTGRDRNLGESRNPIDSRNNNQSNESRNQNEPRSYSKPSSNPVSQTPYNASANYQQNATKFMKGGVLATEPKSASNRYHDDNKIDRRPKSHATPPPSSVTSNINSLIKSTAGMKLSSQPQIATARPSSTGGASSSTSPFQAKPTTQTSNAFDKVFPQMPSGFEYNPYKIMGFQNKETNEFAMNVLKSQSFDNIPPAHMVSGHIQQQTSSVGHAPRQDAYVPMPMATVYAARPPPQQQQTQQQHFSNGGVNLQPFTWPHSLHDICFAKYWEDGRVKFHEVFCLLKH